MSDKAQGNSVRLLTAPGTAAIAVVRIRGHRVAEFIRRRISRDVPQGRLTHVELCDEEGVIDDPVALRHAEDDLELSLHGGAWVVEAVIRLALRDGFMLEHHEAASIDLPWHVVLTPRGVDQVCEDERVFAQQLERKIEADVSIAPTQRALSVLLSQTSAWRARIMRWRDARRTMESDPVDWEALKRRELDFIRSDRAMGNLLGLRGSPTVAIVGIPNAGKSTLANRLLGREGSIVSPTAGTTRDWVEHEAELDGVRVRLLDTPGVRETNDTIEAEAIESSRCAIEQAGVVLLVIDVSIDPEGGSIDAKLQLEMLYRFDRVKCVLSKCDLVDAARVDRWRRLLNHYESVRSGRNVPLSGLCDLILRGLGIDGRESERPLVW